VNVDWEQAWAPYDERTYAAALAPLGREDVVLDIGAGDLRFARRAARVARRVYAVEQNESLLTAVSSPLPPSLIPICGDAAVLPFPEEVTVAVLLMRHCTRFALYARKLQAIGCRTLISNARWRLGVEIIDLQEPTIPYTAVSLGWYACRCGAVGFAPGPPQQLTAGIESTVHQVHHCPTCTPMMAEMKQ
jgi:hypothetical protein